MIYNRGDRVMVQLPGSPEYIGTVQQGSSDETSHMGRPFRWVTVSHPGFDSAADVALIAAAPEIAAALVAIVDAFREPHYGDREQQADSVFDAMERTGAIALVEKLKGIL